MRVMHDAGCGRITFGVETGSQEMLDSIGKRITLGMVRQAVSSARGLGMRVYVPSCFRTDGKRSKRFATRMVL